MQRGDGTPLDDVGCYVQPLLHLGRNCGSTGIFSQSMFFRGFPSLGNSQYETLLDAHFPCIRAVDSPNQERECKEILAGSYLVLQACISFLMCLRQKSRALFLHCALAKFIVMALPKKNSVFRRFSLSALSALPTSLCSLSSPMISPSLTMIRFRFRKEKRDISVRTSLAAAIFGAQPLNL